MAESKRVFRLVAALEQATGKQVTYSIRPSGPEIEIEFIGNPSVFCLVSYRDLENKTTELIVDYVLRAVSFDGIKAISEEPEVENDTPSRSKLHAPDADLENRFTYHAPKPGQPEKYQHIRDMAKSLAYAIKQEAGINRESSLALTNLEQAVFWANAAIARNG